MRKQKLAAAVSVGTMALFVAGLTTAVPSFADSAPVPSPNPCPANSGSATSGTITICVNPATDPPNTQGGNNQVNDQCSGPYPFALLVQLLDQGGKTFPVQTGVTWSISGAGAQYVYLYGTDYPGGVPTVVVGSTITTPTGDIDGIASAGLSVISATPGFDYTIFGLVPPPPAGTPVAPVLTSPQPITITASAPGYGTTTFHETLNPCNGTGVPMAPVGGGIGLAAVAGGTLYMTQRRRRRSAFPTAV